jgi:hypothetical protein
MRKSTSFPGDDERSAMRPPIALPKAIPVRKAAMTTVHVERDEPTNGESSRSGGNHRVLAVRCGGTYPASVCWRPEFGYPRL